MTQVLCIIKWYQHLVQKNVSKWCAHQTEETFIRNIASDRDDSDGDDSTVAVIMLSITNTEEFT